MTTYKTPGVFVEEISTLPASVAPVATAIPAFIGYTDKAAKADGTDLTNVPIRITSLKEFETYFGGPANEALDVEVIDDFDPSDNLINRQVVVGLSSPSGFNFYHAMRLYFANGGGPCWICSVGPYGDMSQADLTDGLDKIAAIDEPTLLVFPDAVSVPTGSGTGTYDGVYKAALTQCNELQDRFVIMDVPYSNSITTDSSDFRTDIGLDNLKYGAAYYPNLKTSYAYAYDETAVSITNTQNGGVTPPAAITGTIASFETTQTALYNLIKAAIADFRVTVPPSGAIAGVYARVDRDRGVWKAPANVSLNNVIEPTSIIDNDDQEGLNVDATGGKSINAIRKFTGKGTLVWGARTLAGNDNEWRYVNVRRLFIFLEESIEKASESVVFEANDANTWLRLKTMIESFLNQQWSAGALAGSTADQAYFVNVGLGSTMTTQDILEGRMIVEIGIAAVRPAEFIVLRFSHKLQEA